MDPTFQSGNIRLEVCSEEAEGAQSLRVMWHGALHVLITQLQTQRSLFYLYAVVQAFKAMGTGSETRLNATWHQYTWRQHVVRGRLCANTGEQLNPPNILLFGAETGSRHEIIINFCFNQPISSISDIITLIINS